MSNWFKYYITYRKLHTLSASTTQIQFKAVIYFQIASFIFMRQVRSTRNWRACIRIRCMNVDGARGVCKDRSGHGGKQKLQDAIAFCSSSCSAFPHGKKAWVYVCICLCSSRVVGDDDIKLTKFDRQLTIRDFEV